MLKIEKTVLPSPEQWEIIIEGLRNPMNSWNKMDSDYRNVLERVCDACPESNLPFGRDCEDCDINAIPRDKFLLGPNDLGLMKKLAKGGAVHAKYRRMIPVYVTIDAPMYWWSEFDTYKVGTVANSCSKMHRLLHKPFEMSDFSYDKLPGYKREVKQFRPVVDEEAEIWRKIDDDYDVSSEGRVRHGKRILSGSVHNDHYIIATLHGKQHPVHRLVAEAFLDNTENKPEVNHIDGNKMNNCVENLEWVTRAENQIHAVKNNLQPKAYGKYKGKFTAEERDAIKRIYDSGMYSRRQLAEKYGVSHTCINDIINDKYKYADAVNAFEEVARPLVDTLNELRDLYFTCEDEAEKKRVWYAILQLLPNSYNQKRTVMLNYEVLVNIYRWRKDHKLDEWHTFCDWIESLPYSELITGSEAV